MPCKADSFRRVYERLAKVSAGSPCWAVCRKGRGNDLQGKWCQRQSLKNERKWLLYDMLLRLEVMRKALPSSHAFRPRSLWASPGYNSIVITPVYRIRRLKHWLKVLLKGNKKGRNGTQVSWFPLRPRSLNPALAFCFLKSGTSHRELPFLCLWGLRSMLSAETFQNTTCTITPRQCGCLLTRPVCTHINDCAWHRVMESPSLLSSFLH